jgi:hypothetical protein
MQVNLREEQRRISRGATVAFALSLLAFGAAHVLVPRLVDLQRLDLRVQLNWWAGSCLVLTLWVMAGVGMVSTRRRHSEADIRGSAFSPPSPAIAVPAAFLQNTLEQAFIAVFTQLALVLVLEVVALPLLVASAVLFSIGRARFLAGYPQGAGARSFGMALTGMPSLFSLVLTAGALVWRAVG